VTVVRHEGSTPAVDATGAPTPGSVVVGRFRAPIYTVEDDRALRGHTYVYAAVPFDRDTPPKTAAASVLPPLKLTRGGAESTAGVGTPPRRAVTPRKRTKPARRSRPARRTIPKPKPKPARRATPKPSAASPNLVTPGAGNVTDRRALGVRWRASSQAHYYNIQLFKGVPSKPDPKSSVFRGFPTGTTATIPGGTLAPGRYLLRVFVGLGRLGDLQYLHQPWVRRVLVVK
jgi:hypothetical protein